MSTATESELDIELDTSGLAADDVLSGLGPDESGLADEVETSVRQDYIAEVMGLVEDDAQKDGLLFFDLETVPDERRFPRPEEKSKESLGQRLIDYVNNPKTTVKDAESLLAMNPPDEEIEVIEAAEKAGKNRDGVFKAIESARKGGGEEMEAWRKLALHPLCCRIAAFGWAVGRGEVRSLTALTDTEERLLLKAFWKLFGQEGRQHCGFNTLAFDVPVIGWRTMLLNVSPSRTLDRRKYSNPQAIDLYSRLFPAGSPGGCDCKTICRALGIEIPAGDEIDGSKVLDYWDAGEFDYVAQYVESDVTIERELYYRTGDVFGT